MESAIAKKDAIITGNHGHCIFLSHGWSLVKCFAELMGRTASCSQGKRGSMDFYGKDANFSDGHGIVGVGTPIPLGCGTALGQKYMKGGCLSFICKENQR